MEQFVFLREDLAAIVNCRWWRWVTIWLSFGGAPCVVSYRRQRAVFLGFGKVAPVVPVLIWPVLLILKVLGSPKGINCRADIGPRFRVLHPSLGVVISGKTVCGRGLVLTGGNCIGSRGKTEFGDIRIGNNVTLGANAAVLRPVRVGDSAKIDAGAAVVDDRSAWSVVVGVPAHSPGLLSDGFEE